MLVWHLFRHMPSPDRSRASVATVSVADLGGPPGVVSIRVLDEDGREVHAQIRGNAKLSRCCKMLGRLGAAIEGRAPAHPGRGLAPGCCAAVILVFDEPVAPRLDGCLRMAGIERPASLQNLNGGNGFHLPQSAAFFAASSSSRLSMIQRSQRSFPAVSS
jgi:hypothetical protein